VAFSPCSPWNSIRRVRPTLSTTVTCNCHGDRTCRVLSSAVVAEILRNSRIEGSSRRPPGSPQPICPSIWLSACPTVPRHRNSNTNIKQ
jgi:hypothetical protein